MLFSRRDKDWSNDEASLQDPFPSQSYFQKLKNSLVPMISRSSTLNYDSTEDVDTILDLYGGRRENNDYDTIRQISSLHAGAQFHTVNVYRNRPIHCDTILHRDPTGNVWMLKSGS